MATTSSPSTFATIFHVACGIGAAAVVFSFLGLCPILLAGLIGSIAIASVIFAGAWLLALVQMTTERLEEQKKGK